MTIERTSKSWVDYRRRMLRETEEFIEFGLTHPEQTIEIPAKPVSEPPFSQAVGNWFWSAVLTDRIDSQVARLRSLLQTRSHRAGTSRRTHSAFRRQ